MNKEQELKGVIAALDLLFELRTEMLNHADASWATTGYAGFCILVRASAYLVDTYVCDAEVVAA